MTTTATQPATPHAIEPDLEAIPQELREQPQWVSWSFEKRDGKWTRVPMVPGGRGGRASTTNPQTWVSFEQAAKFYETVGTAGIGFVFSADDPYAGVDLDACRNPQTGEIAAWAQAIIDVFDRYGEVSPSGTGVKLFLRGRLSGRGTRKTVDGGEIEVYDRGRYFAVTGIHVEGTPETIEERQEALSELYGRLRNGRPSGDGRAVPQATPGRDWAEFVASLKEVGEPKLRRLLEGDTSIHGGDDSKDDASLCAILAHNGFSKGDVDTIMRHSALYRSKWDSKRGSSTYGWQTIDFAFNRLKGAGDSTGEDDPDRRDIPYRATPAGMVWDKATRDGSIPVPLTNFNAKIVANVVRDDGQEQVHHFELEARLCGDGYAPRRFNLPANRFGGLTWVHDQLGAKGIVYPGFSVRDHVRVAI